MAEGGAQDAANAANDAVARRVAASVVDLFEILVNFVNARVVKKRYPTVNAEELVWNATITRFFFAVFSLCKGNTKETDRSSDREPEY